MDAGVILGTDHKNIKKYQKFIFVNNGSRASYEDKTFFEVLPALLKGFSIIPAFTLSESTLSQDKKMKEMNIAEVL